MWLAFAIAAMMTIGTSDFAAAFAGRRTTRQVEILSVTWTQHAIGTALVTGAVLLIDPGSADNTDLAWGVATGLAIGIAKPLYFAGLSYGSITVLAPITTVLSILVPVGFALATGEGPGMLALLGIVLAVPAVVMISSRSTGASKRWSTGLVLATAFVCGSLFGLSAILIGEMGEDAGLQPLLAASLIIWLFVTIGTLAARARLITSGPTLRPAVVSGLLEGTGAAFITLALQRGEVSVAATLLGLAPVVSVLLAWLILREHLDLLHKAAILATCLAVVLMTTG